jgi:hypothetical protein
MGFHEGREIADRMVSVGGVKWEENEDILDRINRIVQDLQD